MTNSEPKVVVPKHLTAENGMKYALIGEFHEDLEIPCPGCAYLPNCSKCSGTGVVTIQVPVEWHTIKAIHRAIVKKSEPVPPVEPPAPSEDPVVTLQNRIANWADSVFPDRTPENALHKMLCHELPELLNGGLDDPLEYADVLILLLDIAKLRGIDAIAAAHEKMTINEGRTWERGPDGLMSHVKDGE